MPRSRSKQMQIYSIDDIPLFVDIPFMCDIFKVSCETIRRRCVEGRIKAVKFGDAWRIPKTEITRLFEEGGTV